MIRSALRRVRAHSHAVISRGDGRALIWLELRRHWIAWIGMAGIQHSTAMGCRAP